MNTDLSIDERKLQVEKDKLKLERQKTYLTGVGVVLPLIGILLTLVISANNQSRLERFQAELEVTKIVMGSDIRTPPDRLAVMKDLFNKHLDSGFGHEFETKFVGADPAAVEHRKLVRLLADHIKDREKVLELWKRMFPDDHDLDNYSVK